MPQSASEVFLVKIKVLYDATLSPVKNIADDSIRHLPGLRQSL